MTAALSHLTGPVVRTRLNAARLVSFLAIALPVPVLGLLGLSLPLPATVERLAAKLVPFGEAGTAQAHPFARGEIVLAPDEHDVARRSTTAGNPARVIPAPTSALPSRAEGAPNAGGGQPSGFGPQRGVGERNSTPTNGGGSSAPAPSGGGATPSAVGENPEPTPTPTPTPTPPPSLTPAVDNVVTTATDTTSAVTNTVDNAASAVTDLAGGIHHP